jgi:hypothetical protein
MVGGARQSRLIYVSDVCGRSESTIGTSNLGSVFLIAILPHVIKILEHAADAALLTNL